MSNAIGSTHPRSDETPIELQEMIKAIDALPSRYRDAVAPAMQRVIECSTRRRRILNLVQEALSQLRLDITAIDWNRTGNCRLGHLSVSLALRFNRAPALQRLRTSKTV